jgi:hypothetical protein
MSRSEIVIGLAGLLCLLADPCIAAAGSSGRSAGRMLFERRILPIFRSSQPSSCAECHLGGVSLQQFVAPTEVGTLRLMREQGLVSLQRPDSSRILRFIRRSPPNPTLISRRVRKQEYEAFRAWIVASAQNPTLRAVTAPSKAKNADLKTAVKTQSASSRDPLLVSFERNLWTEHLRCSNCHVPGSSQNQKFVQQFGERVSWFVPGDPAATMKKIIDHGLVNVSDPEKSLLLLKPTQQVPHGGGKKLMVGDRTYKAFRQWIEEYAASVRGLPRPATMALVSPGEWLVRSECWLKIEATPPSWGDRPLAVDLFAWDTAKGRWSERVAARADRGVWGGGKLWQQTLSPVLRDARLVQELLPQSQAEGMYFSVPYRLPAGRYLIRIYCDTEGALERDWRIEIRQPRFFVGEVEVESAWPTGYANMTVIKAPMPTAAASRQ